MKDGYQHLQIDSMDEYQNMPPTDICCQVLEALGLEHLLSVSTHHISVSI